MRTDRSARMGMISILVGLCVSCASFGAETPVPIESEKGRKDAASAEKSLWMTDFEAAKAKAKAENKLLLADFTGSDWCAWCFRLKGEVFDKEYFQTEAPKHFVLVELDYPSKKQLEKKLKEQNDELRKKYKIRGYPTVLLMDAAGDVIARTGYQAGGPEGYIKHLDEFRDVYGKLAALKRNLEKVQGLDRVKLLDQLVDLYGKLNNEDADSLTLSQEIVKLDPENKTGLKTKHEFRVLVTEADQLKEARQFAEAKASYEKAANLAGITAEQKQDAYFAQGECSFNEKDFAGVVGSLQKALDAAPESRKAKQIKGMIARFEGIAASQEAIRKLKQGLDKAQGIERAKLLDQLVDAQAKFNQSTMAQGADKDIDKWTKEILALDPENKAGLKAKHECRLVLAEAAGLMRARETDKALALVEKVLATPAIGGEQAQEARALQASIWMSSGNLRNAADALKKAVDAAPNSLRAQMLKSGLTNLEKQLERADAKAGTKQTAPKKDASK